MSELWNWLEICVDTLMLPFRMLQHFLEGLIFIIDATRYLGDNLILFFEWLPGEIMVYVTAFVGIAIMYKLSGRD